jgi:hypothetical protein
VVKVSALALVNAAVYQVVVDFVQALAGATE